MLQRLKQRVSVVAFATLAGFSMGSRALAAEAVAPAGSKPAMVGYASLASLDALASLSNDLGIPVPPIFTAKGIEETFPVLGLASIAADKPIGVAFIGAPDITQDKAAVFVLPVKPGTAQVKTLAGATPLSGHADTVIVNGNPFRRTADDFLFGTHPNGVAALDPTLIAASLKGKGALARMSVDLQALRRAMPEKFGAFFTDLEKRSSAKGADEKFGEQLVIVALRDKLNKLTLGFDRTPKNIVVSTTIEPVQVPAPTAGPRPGLPAGITGRVDLAASPVKTFPWADENLVNMLYGLGAKEAAPKFTPEQSKAFSTLITSGGRILLGGDAWSAGLAFDNDKPVLYVVNHYAAAPAQFNADLKKWVADAKALNVQLGNPHIPARLTTYAAGDATVSRVQLNDDTGKLVGLVDFLISGNSVLYAVSASDGHYVQALLNLPAAGEATTLISGHVDLGKFFDLAIKSPPAGFATLSAEQRKQIAQAMKGQKLTFSASGQGNVLTIGAAVSNELVTGLLRLVPMDQQ